MLDFTLPQMGFFCKTTDKLRSVDMFLQLLLLEIEPISTMVIAMQQFVCHYTKIHMNT